MDNRRLKNCTLQRTLSAEDLNGDWHGPTPNPNENHQKLSLPDSTAMTNGAFGSPIRCVKMRSSTERSGAWPLKAPSGESRIMIRVFNRFQTVQHETYKFLCTYVTNAPRTDIIGSCLRWQSAHSAAAFEVRDDVMMHHSSQNIVLLPVVVAPPCLIPNDTSQCKNDCDKKK